jgi:hypothetical protein
MAELAAAAEAIRIRQASLRAEIQVLAEGLKKGIGDQANAELAAAIREVADAFPEGAVAGKKCARSKTPPPSGGSSRRAGSALERSTVPARQATAHKAHDAADAPGGMRLLAGPMDSGSFSAQAPAAPVAAAAVPTAAVPTAAVPAAATPEAAYDDATESDNVDEVPQQHTPPPPPAAAAAQAAPQQELIDLTHQPIPAQQQQPAAALQQPTAAAAAASTPQQQQPVAAAAARTSKSKGKGKGKGKGKSTCRAVRTAAKSVSWTLKKSKRCAHTPALLVTYLSAATLLISGRSTRVASSICASTIQMMAALCGT